MWEEKFLEYLGTLLEKPSNQLFTCEKTERIRSVLINGKGDSARFRQYVKEKQFALINCPEFRMENELCIPANEESRRMGILTNWKKVVTVDKIFEVLKSVHEGARAHTGYHKLYKDVEQTYYGIPRKACMEFIKGCVQCACKKPQRNVAPLTPITSKYFMHRGQLDLVDKRADPDGQYCWIGHYIDHYTKFNFFWPQMNKSADEVVHNLSVHVFSVVGLPSILQHDNGREFCNAVIRETLKLWPGDGDVKIITGRPRHPRTQGLVEQVHDSLHKLLASKRADKPGSGWLEFLYEIQYSLNTQCHSSIKMTPFEAVFGQKANDGICVGSQETDEFIDEENIEYMIEGEGDVMTDGQTENETS
ncbi:SCAN domain-containing protein 3-like [Mytilus edulis]|uniref:SCAN domain-containing protein 3-like n=1 Tax=Mytilus edulis TaxID=6550 RepID=UPI0039F0B54C